MSSLMRYTAPGDRQAKTKLIQEGADLKVSLAALEKRAEAEQELMNRCYFFYGCWMLTANREGAKVPNTTHPDVPIGDTPVRNEVDVS